jgi:hypothetical protein
MSEQQPIQKTIAEALKTRAEPVADVLYKDGQQFRLAGGHGLGLDVYPSAGVVRVTLPTGSRAELHGQGEPHIEEDCVVFEGRRQTLIVQADGAVVWTWKPKPTERPRSGGAQQEVGHEPTEGSGEGGSQLRHGGPPLRKPKRP